MALTIGDNFKYQANKPNFERDSFATLEAMKAYPETSIDDGHLSYCAETNKHYKFLSSNTVDETTGKWREFETGASISEDGVTGQVLTKTDDGYKWQDPQGSQEPQETRIVLDEFSERKFFDEFLKVTGAPAIGWAGALFIDDFSSSEHRDFYCCMTYGQGIVIRHTYKTGVYEYLNSFMVDSSTTSSSYNITNKMNSGGWGKYYDNSELPLAYISRCSPNASYIHTYYAYKINRSVTPFKFERVLTIKYGGSKLAAITSDITIDAEKKYLYVHGYKSGSADAITGTSIVMVFNLPEPGSSDTITLNDSDILWEFEFFVNEAAQDLCVSGGRLYYPYGSKSVHGLAVVDTKTGEIIQNLDLANISTNFISNPEPEGVALSNGNLYLNYHHADTNSNEVCLVEFALQGVKESLKVPTSQSEGSVDIPNATQSTAGLMSTEDKTKLDSIDVDNINNTLNDTRALKGATMRFNGFVNGVNITQTEVHEWDGIVYDTSINKFLAKKGTLTPTYHNVWSGMDAYMSDELGTSILKDKLYIYGENVYKWSDSEGTLVKITSEGSSTTPDIPLATQNTDGLMSSEDKTKLDNIDVDSVTEAINDKRALNGATMRFSSFVNGVTVEQVGTVEFDSIVFDTAISKFLAKKNGTLSPTYYNVWQGMDAYMSDESGTSILKDKLYICDDVVYSWSDVENTLVKVDKEISNATQSKAGLISAEDKAKLDGVSNNANNYTHPAGSAASKSLGLYKISTDSTSHVKSVSAVTKSDITSLGIPAQDTTYNNATSTSSGLMSASDKEKLDSINVDNEAINVVADARALKGATMRFNGFVSGVTIAQVGASEWDSIVYDTSINKFLAKKGTLSPTYYNIWSGMDAYMTDSIGTDILKDRLYLYGEDIYAWSDTEGTLVKVGKEMPTMENIEILDGEIMAQDHTSIISVDLMQLVHSNEQQITSTKYMAVVSSTATSITLSSEDIANFPVSTVPGLRTAVVTAAVVGFSDGEYKVVYFGAPSENTLPLADFDNTDLTDAMSVQALFNDSQHLSASGYIAMGKFVADEIIKKTSLVDRNWIGGLVFNTLGLRKGTSDTPEKNAVYDLNDNVVCLPVFYNWMRGGVTPNGNNLVNDHGTTQETFNLFNGWVTKAYKVAQGKKGAYVEFPIVVSGKGFVEIQAGKVATKATSTGGCEITLYADGVAVGTQVLVMNQTKYTFSDITIKKEMRVRFTLLADEDTEFSIYSIGFWKMYQPVPAPIVDGVTRIAVLGDSWTQYPTADISLPRYPDWNTVVTRPDGTTGEGYGYFPKALANFTNAHVDNWGKGGMRSDNWGLVKINDILNYARYDYLIVEFFINDQTAGMSVSDWKQNIKRICDKCKQFGTRPIFIMPCGVKSSPQKAELGKWHEEVVKGLGA